MLFQFYSILLLFMSNVNFCVSNNTSDIMEISDFIVILLCMVKYLVSGSKPEAAFQILCSFFCRQHGFDTEPRGCCYVFPGQRFDRVSLSTSDTPSNMGSAGCFRATCTLACSCCKALLFVSLTVRLATFCATYKWMCVC